LKGGTKSNRDVYPGREKERGKHKKGDNILEKNRGERVDGSRDI